MADEKKELPPPRSTGNIQLKFTPRAFVTPSRESKAPEEEAVSYGHVNAGSLWSI